MSTIFSGYVLRDIILSLLVAFFAFTLILFVGNSVRLIAEQVPLIRLLRMMPYLMLLVSTYTIPMALLTAVVLTFGRMGVDNELTAIRAGGLSLSVVVLPVLLLALVFSVLSLPLNTRIVPRCNFIVDTMIQADFWDSDIQWTDRHEPALNLPSHKVFIGEGRGDVYRDVFICEMVNRKPTQFIIADAATIDLNKNHTALDFVLRDGILYYAEKGVSDSVDAGTFDTYRFSADVPSARTVPSGIKETGQDELKRLIEEKLLPNWKMPKAVTEFHKRISLSFSCLALVLVGVPLGMLARRGNMTAAFGASIAIIFVLYYPLFVMGEVLGNMDALAPVIGMWVPNVAAAATGTALFWRTRRGLA